MTICIAALAENGRKAVVASDKMITAHIPMGYEFEKDDIHKVQHLTPSCVVLTAGNVLFADEIIRNARSKIVQERTDNFQRIAEIVREEYQRMRLKIAVQQHVIPHGITLEQFYQSQQMLHMNIVMQIDKQLVDFNLQTEMLLTGKNADGTFQIYSIQHPGIAIAHDSIGFACIGSGAPHAMYSLIDEKYCKECDETTAKDKVKKAKERSEVAPGVGEQLELIVLPSSSSPSDATL